MPSLQVCPKHLNPGKAIAKLKLLTQHLASISAKEDYAKPPPEVTAK
jgi:succinate dehydrogenase/fumarate reductase-like Fe-S protein